MKYVIVVLLAVYVLFGVYLYAVQDSLLFFPDNENFYDCNAPAYEFNGTRFYLYNTSNTVVVYYHGNAGSACDRVPLRTHFGDASVLFVEYAGYAGDTTAPSGARILQDVRNIHTVASSFDTVLVYGQSIGTGAASYHAYLGADSVMVVSGFDSLRRLAQSAYVVYPGWLVRTEFANARWLSSFNGSITVVHGAQDNIIAPSMSKGLPGRRIIIDGVGHNDIWSSPQFTAVVQQWTAQYMDDDGV